MPRTKDLKDKLKQRQVYMDNQLHAELSTLRDKRQAAIRSASGDDFVMTWSQHVVGSLRETLELRKVAGGLYWGEMWQVARRAVSLAAARKKRARQR